MTLNLRDLPKVPERGTPEYFHYVEQSIAEFGYMLYRMQMHLGVLMGFHGPEFVHVKGERRELLCQVVDECVAMAERATEIMELRHQVQTAEGTMQ